MSAIVFVLALSVMLNGRADAQALITIDSIPEPQAKSTAHATIVAAVRAWNATRRREAQACAKGVARPANGLTGGGAATLPYQSVRDVLDPHEAARLAWTH